MITSSYIILPVFPFLSSFRIKVNPLQEPFADHIPTFQGKKQIADTSLLRPAEVQFSDRIVVEYLDNRELVPLELKTSPKQTVTTTRPKHEDMDNYPATPTPLTS